MTHFRDSYSTPYLELPLLLDLSYRLQAYPLYILIIKVINKCHQDIKFIYTSAIMQAYIDFNKTKKEKKLAVFGYQQIGLT